MIRGFLSLYSFNYPRIVIYMLQSTEYMVKPYLQWYWRTANFTQVARRRSLDMTRRAKLLLLMIRLGMALQIALAIVLLVYAYDERNWQLFNIGVVVLLSFPVMWAHLITIPLVLARHLIAVPLERRIVKQSAELFNKHGGIKIAVLGSYGKTTVKELLLTVLGAGKDVAATPANKNVAASHARWVRTLTGKEEVLIIEYGEGAPGDIKRFADTTKPDLAVITGVAPAHLDQYKTLEAAAQDIFSIVDVVGSENTYVNRESEPLLSYVDKNQDGYDASEAMGWKISKISVSVDKTSFVMKKGKKTLNLHSGLVGRHLVGPLAFCAAIASELGMTNKQIEKGVADTKPFEHRMQPRLLAGGWVIDDTYNGNLEGVRAGLSLLSELKAKRKIYVTPGLVDQGEQTEAIHHEVGELIADAKPDKVVLMKNSVTAFIQAGLTAKEYSGEVVIEDDPLRFYTHLDQVIAVGDVVLMQNDWTDNYN